jgi:hypothetical protein
LTELVRRGPGREGRVSPRRGLPARSAGNPRLASRTGPGPAKSPPPRKKTADSSRFSADSSLCGWKWVAERAGLGQVCFDPASCRSGRKCRLRSFSAEMRSVWAVAGLSPQPFHRLTCTSVWTTFCARCRWRIRRLNRRPLPSPRASNCKTGDLRHATDKRVESGEAEPGAGGGRSSTPSSRGKPELWSSGQCR